MSADTNLMPIPGPVDPVPVPRAATARADGKVELVGLVEDGLVAIRRADERKDAVAGPNPLARELRVARRAPAIPLHGTVEAEELLDGRAP